jgi:hypothetical protein
VNYRPGACDDASRMTADPADLIRAWQQAIGHLRSAAGPLTGVPEDVARQLLAPLQQQAELLEQSLRRQVAFEKEIVERMLGPVTVVLELLDQSAAAMRTQAQAFDAAAASFKQASELLELQASLLEGAGRSLRDPAHALRAAGAAVRRGDSPMQR